MTEQRCTACGAGAALSRSKRARRRLKSTTQLYMQRMPLVPEEELLASSRRHPLHPAMTWLLHTRRVPTLPPRQLLELALNSPAH